MIGKPHLSWAGTMRAGDGNRTRMTSLEGWGSTIELRPHNLPASVARLRAPAHQAGRHRQRTGSVPLPAPRRPHDRRQQFHDHAGKAPYARVFFRDHEERRARQQKGGDAPAKRQVHVPHARPGLRPSRRLPPRLVIE